MNAPGKILDMVTRVNLTFLYKRVHLMQIHRDFWDLISKSIIQILTTATSRHKVIINIFIVPTHKYVTMLPQLLYVTDVPKVIQQQNWHSLLYFLNSPDCPSLFLTVTFRRSAAPPVPQSGLTGWLLHPVHTPSFSHRISVIILLVTMLSDVTLIISLISLKPTYVLI